MKAISPWITYRTRFLVKAKQLNSPLSFTDSLGRQHSGRKGDYLVESSDGVLRIAPRQIFEDIYVPLLSSETQAQVGSRERPNAPQEQENPRSETAVFSLPHHLIRKSPQPCRDRHSPIPGLRSL
jgi:hypothetical protein